MKKTLSALALLTLLMAIPFLSAAPAAPAKDPLKGLDAYIEKALKDWNLPGLAVSVVKDGKVVLAKGYGVREIGKPEPVNADTIFAIGSNSKAFTATAVGLLVQEGKLSWDDRAIDRLPGFQLYDPYVTREILVRDLLSHRSGLGRRGDLLWLGQDFSREEILRRIRFLKPETSFRGAMGYQNIMVLAAGQLIPAVTGTSWDDFIKERFFKPLGMGRSSTSTKELPGFENVARPHSLRQGKMTAIPYRNIDNIAPAGSINSSVVDMARWELFQLGNGTFEGRKIIDPAVLQVTRDPHIMMPISPARRKAIPSNHFQAYGLGWVLEDYRGRLIVWHNGGIDGMLSQQGFLPEENLGITVLTNSDHNSLSAALFYRIIDAFLGDPVKDWSAAMLEQSKQGEALAAAAQKKAEESRVKGTKPSLDPAAYAGRYGQEMYGVLEVRNEGGALHLYFNAKPAGILEHWHYDTFHLAIKGFENDGFGNNLEDLPVTFVLNADGKPARIDLGGLETFERLPDPPEKKH